MVDLALARRFIDREARLVDRLALAALLDSAPAEPILRALGAYQNNDGGFGHALEPDTRTGSSQPLYFEVALGYMADAGVVDPAMVLRACDWLASVLTDNGGALILVPGYKNADFAAHWTDAPQAASINPNGGIAGLLLKFGISHPVVDRLEAFCWQALEKIDGAHDVSEALLFLANTKDAERAEHIAEDLVRALPATRWYKADPAASGYGLDTLFYAPTPDAFATKWFDPNVIREALEHLESRQQTDGGWPIDWTPPGAAAIAEWRGIMTVKAVRTLQAYGRL